jgi:DNA-binding transcriptional regulator YdaS (Cro superfamily)
LEAVKGALYWLEVRQQEIAWSLKIYVYRASQAAQTAFVHAMTDKYDQEWDSRNISK